jgi:hypothetical protein
MCVLRASGRHFEPQAFADSTSLGVVAIYRRGDKSRLRKRSALKVSGLNIRVCKASWSDLPKQVRLAERFLKKNAREIKRLVRFRGVESVTLDFPSNLRIGHRNVAVQSDHFPRSLVHLAAQLGLALELTTYG